LHKTYNHKADTHTIPSFLRLTTVCCTIGYNDFDVFEEMEKGRVEFGSKMNSDTVS